MSHAFNLSDVLHGVSGQSRAPRPLVPARGARALLPAAAGWEGLWQEGWAAHQEWRVNLARFRPGEPPCAPGGRAGLVFQGAARCDSFLGPVPPERVDFGSGFSRATLLHVISSPSQQITFLWADSIPSLSGSCSHRSGHAHLETQSSPHGKSPLRAPWSRSAPVNGFLSQPGVERVYFPLLMLEGRVPWAPGRGCALWPRDFPL